MFSGVKIKISIVMVSAGILSFLSVHAMNPGACVEALDVHGPTYEGSLAFAPGFHLHIYYAWTVAPEVKTLPGYPDGYEYLRTLGGIGFPNSDRLVKETLKTYRVGGTHYSSVLEPLEANGPLAQEILQHQEFAFGRLGSVVGSEELSRFRLREKRLDRARVVYFVFTDAQGRTVSVIRLFDGTSSPGMRSAGAMFPKIPDGSEILPLKSPLEYPETVFPETAEYGDKARLYELGMLAGDVLTEANEYALLHAVADWIGRCTRNEHIGGGIPNYLGMIYSVATEKGVARHTPFGFIVTDQKLHPAPDGSPRFLIKFPIMDLLRRYDYPGWNCKGPIFPRLRTKGQ